MYNPEQLDLPDYEDQRLTEYLYGYDVPFIHAIAYNSDEHSEPPFIEMEFWTPFKVRVPFHFMMWPDTPTIIENQRVFEVEKLDPSGAAFPGVEAEVLAELGVSSNDAWKPDISSWFENATSDACDKLAIVKYRVRYEWTIRAWQGLTLEYLEQQLASDVESLDFAKDFVVPEGSVLLETFEPEDAFRRPSTLEIQLGGDQTMATEKERADKEQQRILTTTYSNQAAILGALWLNYRNDEKFSDFVEYNDIGLPVAYAIANKIVLSTPLAEKFINETFVMLLNALGIEDKGFESLDDMFAIANNN